MVNIEVDEDKSLSSLEQIPSEKPAESSTEDKVEMKSVNIDDNQTGESEEVESLQKVPEETPDEMVFEGRVDNVPMEVSEEDKVKSPQPSPIEMVLGKVSGAAPSQPQEGKMLQEVSIFQDLCMRKDSSARSPNDWELQFSSDQLAAFTWMEKSLMVVLRLGEKLKPTKTRKSLGRVVHHWTISDIEFHPCHLDGGAPENTEQHIIQAGQSVFLSQLSRLYISLISAQFCVLRKFPDSNLSSHCPNTYSLNAFLTNVSTCVEPAITFTKALKWASERYFPFEVKDNTVTLGKEP